MTYPFFFLEYVLLVGRWMRSESFVLGYPSALQVKEGKVKSPERMSYQCEPGAEWTRKRVRAAEGEEQKPAYIC